MKEFKSFDPLKAKQIADTEVAASALKREIENILSSYVGWYKETGVRDQLFLILGSIGL